MNKETQGLHGELLVGQENKAEKQAPEIVIVEGFKSSRGVEVVGEKSTEGPLRDHSREYDAEMDKVAEYTEEERLINKKLFGRETPGTKEQRGWCIFDEFRQAEIQNGMTREAAEKLLELRKTGDSKAARLIGKLLGRRSSLGSFSEELQKAQHDFDELKSKTEDGRKKMGEQFREILGLVISEKTADETAGSTKDRKQQRTDVYDNFIRRLESDIPTINPTPEELIADGYRKDSSVDKDAAIGRSETSDVFSEEFDPDATAYRDLYDQGFQFKDSNNRNPDTKRYDVYIKEGEHTASLKLAFEANADLEEVVKDAYDQLHADKDTGVVFEPDIKHLEELSSRAYVEKERLEKELEEGKDDTEGKSLKERMIKNIEKTLKRWDTVMQELDIRDQEEKQSVAA